MAIDYPRFTKELRVHDAPEYHQSSGPIERSTALSWFGQAGLEPPAPYLEFLTRFGPGRYFAGSLVLFDFSEGASGILPRTAELPPAARAKYFAIGYDGTTEGCFCLARSGGDPAVSWCRWEGGSVQREAPDFAEWIESQPKRLFKSKTYAGYRPVKQPEEIARIVQERAAFDVRLIEFDKEIVYEPGKESAFLPRYNRIVLGITKRRDVGLQKLTIIVCREGSKYGKDNIEYQTLDVASLPVGRESRVEAHVFDPYNRPFEKITVAYGPGIDLKSRMRTHFKEIVDFL